ncbi:hypothetical protein RKD26_000427 [Streptomyces calvus]
MNAALVARDTEGEARETLREIVAHADTEAVEGFGAAVAQAGRSTDGKGMWQAVGVRGGAGERSDGVAGSG